ncbi:hypothetical protein [Acidisphaera sp. L21]|uniref:hypothetical protein n=1 Tax=Acidisphaera sp. L21 TaxID=1641851 RepID=UPI00131BFF1E|nr:hypothetical protein [Acidisphaera sp. L21]
MTTQSFHVATISLHKPVINLQNGLMTSDDKALIQRMAGWAQNDPCQVKRADLMRLMMLAEMDDTPPFDRLTKNPHDTILMSADIVRSMIRLIVARDHDVPPAARHH